MAHQKLVIESETMKLSGTGAYHIIPRKNHGMLPTFVGKFLFPLFYFLEDLNETHRVS